MGQRNLLTVWKKDKRLGISDVTEGKALLAGTNNSLDFSLCVVCLLAAEKLERVRVCAGWLGKTVS